MTPDEHQRERRALWCAAYIEAKGFAEDRALIADNCVIEFDKRFPAPAAVEVAPDPSKPLDETAALKFIRSCAVNGTLPSWLLDGKDMALVKGFAAAEAELTTLRDKARLYDELCSVGDALADGYTDGIYPTEDDYEGALK